MQLWHGGPDHWNLWPPSLSTHNPLDLPTPRPWTRLWHLSHSALGTTLSFVMVLSFSSYSLYGLFFSQISNTWLLPSGDWRHISFLQEIHCRPHWRAIILHSGHFLHLYDLPGLYRQLISQPLEWLAVSVFPVPKETLESLKYNPTLSPVFDYPLMEEISV
jgi:hypothetical protein